jgi:hypothetical protein
MEDPWGDLLVSNREPSISGTSPPDFSLALSGRAIGQSIRMSARHGDFGWATRLTPQSPVRFLARFRSTRNDAAAREPGFSVGFNRHIRLYR